jgi:hypothetical protein
MEKRFLTDQEERAYAALAKAVRRLREAERRARTCRKEGAGRRRSVAVDRDVPRGGEAELRGRPVAKRGRRIHRATKESRSWSRSPLTTCAPWPSRNLVCVRGLRRSSQIRLDHPPNVLAESMFEVAK